MTTTPDVAVRTPARPRRRPRLLPAGPVGGQRTRTVLAGLAVLYAAGWGLGLYEAVAYLAGDLRPSRQGWVDAGASIVDTVASGVAVVFAALLFAHWRGVGPRALGLALPRGARGWWEQVATLGAYVVLTEVGFGVGDVIARVLGSPALAYPQVPSRAGDVASLASSALAGPTEEVVLLAVVVVLLRRCGWGWGPVIALDVVVRVSFHAYYGWGCLGLALWALGLAVLYARTGRLLAFVVGHSLWDCSQDLQSLAHAQGLVGLVLLAGVGLAIAGLATGVFSSRPRPLPGSFVVEPMHRGPWGTARR